MGRWKIRTVPEPDIPSHCRVTEWKALLVSKQLNIAALSSLVIYQHHEPILPIDPFNWKTRFGLL